MRMRECACAASIYINTYLYTDEQADPTLESLEAQERDDVLRALVCVGCQLLPEVHHTCLCRFTWGLSVAECNRRAKLGCIEVLAMLRERGDSIQVCACQLPLQSIT